MKIGSAAIGMESARSYASTQQTVSFIGIKTRQLSGISKEEQVSESTKSKGQPGKGSLQEFRERMNNVSRTGKISSREENKSLMQIRQECIRFILQLFMGDTERTHEMSIPWEQAANQMASGPMEKLYTVTNSTYFSESESTTFSTTGKVVTADGREIEFGLEMQMSRRFEAYYEKNYQYSQVITCDPLVINLESNMAELSDQKFLFDLDADGTEESISNLAGGSGYLAWDRNEDGIINDGKELFGTASGDGFKDLAAYDADGNGWIDENDPIYSKLRIWCRDENGKDVLYKLSDQGVGAICLQKIGTEFSVNSRKTNEVNGYIRSTGMFLYEDGRAGTVQHLDVAK